MGKKKYSTGSVKTESKDTEIVSSEAIEVIEEEVVSESVETEEKAETISPETEPLKEEKIKFVSSKKKGKVIGITATTIVLLFEDGKQRVVDKPSYPVKLRDTIEI